MFVCTCLLIFDNVKDYICTPLPNGENRMFLSPLMFSFQSVYNISTPIYIYKACFPLLKK